MSSMMYLANSDSKQNAQSNYPIYTTPTKENFCSININPNNNDENYYIDSTNNHNLKQVIFKIANSKYESSNDSSLTHYLKSDNSCYVLGPKIPQKKNNGNPPTKKNLFSIFENTLKSPKTPVQKKRKMKHLFECSASSTTFATSNKKKRRCRKNKEQIEQLNSFYADKDKKWNRNDIKEISEKTGIKETKVYKWLWDKKNKEEKKRKFYILRK